MAVELSQGPGPVRVGYCERAVGTSGVFMNGLTTEMKPLELMVP